MEKIVEVRTEKVEAQIITETRNVPVVTEKIIEVEKIVPYIEVRYEPVNLREEKVVVNHVEVQKIVPVETILEKVVAVSYEIIKPVEIEKIIEKAIEVQKLVTAENRIPFKVETQNVVEVFRDKIVEIPLIHFEIQ